MGHFAVFDLTESGEKIGRKLFALLTKTQQKELERFISESKNSKSDSVLSPCYPAFYGQYSIPRQSDQPLTEIQEGDLYFCLEQRLVTGGMCDMLTDQNYATVEAALTAGTMPTDSRSIVIDYNVVKKNEDIRSARRYMMRNWCKQGMSMPPLPHRPGRYRAIMKQS